MSNVLPTKLKLRNDVFEYEKSNPYQKVIYRQMSKQVNEITLNSKQVGDQHPEVLKLIGVLEFLIDRYKKYGSLKRVKHLYESR